MLVLGSPFDLVGLLLQPSAFSVLSGSVAWVPYTSILLRSGEGLSGLFS